MLENFPFLSNVSGVSNYVHKTPLGIVQPRIGGLPMSLVYFVAPYDLVNTKTKTVLPMTVEGEELVAFTSDHTTRPANGELLLVMW